MALSTNNKTAYFGGKDKFIYQIDLTSHSIIQKIKAHNEAVTGILVDLNKEQFYSVGNDHLLKVWSSETNQSVQLETFYGHTAKVNTITTIPGDVTRIITSGMDNFINLWKVDSQSFLQYKYNEIYPVDCLAGLNGGVFLSGDFNGKVAGWRTGKKKPVCEIEYEFMLVSLLTLTTVTLITVCSFCFFTCSSFSCFLSCFLSFFISASFSFFILSILFFSSSNSFTFFSNSYFLLYSSVSSSLIVGCLTG